jgi:hypothetical protein
MVPGVWQDGGSSQSPGCTKFWSMMARAAVSAGALLLAALPLGAVAAEPITAARFSITIDGVEIASFVEAKITSRILVDSSSDRVRSGEQATAALRRAQTADMSLYNWYLRGLTARTPERKDIEISAYGATGEVVARHLCRGGFPVEVRSLKSQASEVIMESVTIVCEAIRRVE